MWARWASGGGAAVRVGRLRPRGVVSAAMAACRDRIRLPTRALSLCRDPSLVVNGRSSSSSPPLAAATCPCRPCDPVFHPPAPPHHPCVMERRCPAAGGVKHARGGVRQGVITHHPLVPSSTHDGQGHAPTTAVRAYVMDGHCTRARSASDADERRWFWLLKST